MFEAVNDESLLISINDTYSNHHLRKSGVLTKANFSGGTQDAFVAQISAAGMVAPLIVLRPRAINSIAVAAHNAQNSSFWVTSWWNYTIDSGIEYYIFDRWSPPTEGCGLELRNSLDQLMYHSCWHRLKVLDRYDVGQWAGGIGGYYDVPLINRGRRMGVMMLNPRVSSVALSGEVMAVLQECSCFTTDLNLRVGTVQLSNSDGWWYVGTGWWNKQPMSFLTIDIENLPLGVTLG